MTNKKQSTEEPTKAQWTYSLDFNKSWFEVWSPDVKFFAGKLDELTAKFICDRFNQLDRLKAENAEIESMCPTFEELKSDDIIQHPATEKPSVLPSALLVENLAARTFMPEVDDGHPVMKEISNGDYVQWDSYYNLVTAIKQMLTIIATQQSEIASLKAELEEVRKDNMNFAEWTHTHLWIQSQDDVSIFKKRQMFNPIPIEKTTSELYTIYQSQKQPNPNGHE